MQNSTAILLLVIILMIFAVNTSDSVHCYKCHFASPDVASSDDCIDPANHSRTVPTCIGLSCSYKARACIGTAFGCEGKPGIEVDRYCLNSTDYVMPCLSSCSSSSSAKLTESQCVCQWNKCNDEKFVFSPGDSTLKSASSVVLVAVVLMQHFMSAITSD